MKNIAKVYRTETLAIGGGEWSIVVYDELGECITEFVGSNGTRDDHPADLWAEFNEWAEQECPLTYVKFSLEKLYALGERIIVGYSMWNDHVEAVCIADSWDSVPNNLYAVEHTARAWEKILRSTPWEEMCVEEKLLARRVEE